MTGIGVEALVNALSDQRLLAPEQYREFSEGILSVCQEPSVLIEELVYRGWLTDHQLEAIRENHLKKLFLGSYTLRDPIGEGSMGRVFLARNWKTQQDFALKVIRDEHSSNVMAIRRFHREIKALRKADHPNVVAVYDADTIGDILFYVMEYVPGTDLGKLLKQCGPFQPAKACEFALQAAVALDHLHGNGLIHRDVKPTNLLFGAQDRRIKLLDLGLARFQTNQQQFSGNLTRLGIIIGTPDYISPEQIQDPRTATIRSDIYSLGCTLYHLLAGRPPFDDVPTVDKLYHQCFSKPTPIEQLRGDLPPRLVKAINKMMEKKPRWRHRHPRQVMGDLQAVLKELGPYGDSDPDMKFRPEDQRTFENLEEQAMTPTEHVAKVPFYHLFENQNVPPASGSKASIMIGR